MSVIFNPTAEETRALEALIAAIPGIQDKLVRNHALLTRPDRGAHQMQLAGGKVVLTLERTLPPALAGLGIFTHDGSVGPHFVGIGRMSTGLGCPHAETDADFLGLMVAFRARSGRRIDFITINDPTSPTDTPEEFVALLHATADAAGATGMLANQARLLLSLARHAGIRAAPIAAHVTGQTRRTVRSSSAYQQYWTGIVRARDTLGKFTFIPVDQVEQDTHGSRAPKHFTADWRVRNAARPLAFELHWIPFLNEVETPVGDLTTAWRDNHKVRVATVAFPQVNPDTRESKLIALLASELGANPGNWQETPDDSDAGLPSTRFTAARALAYRASQKHRGALPDDSYQSFFEKGDVGEALAATLIARYKEKRAARQWVPDLGDL
jgi:hypothetical protein